jgi:hypothetical protein
LWLLKSPVLISNHLPGVKRKTPRRSKNQEPG